MSDTEIGGKYELKDTRDWKLNSNRGKIARLKQFENYTGLFIPAF